MSAVCALVAALAGILSPSAPAQGLQTEQIFICWLYSPDKAGTNGVIKLLKSLKAVKSGQDWIYDNAALQKRFIIRLVGDFDGMRQALYTEDAHVIINGHSNYGMGGVFATGQERSSQRITDIRFIDDDRILTYSSPWISVYVPKCRTSQSYPNWWPIFKDGTSGLMPLEFNDSRGLPPHNYCLTYQVPGDPTFYPIVTAHNSALERFPDSKIPAWYSPDGSAPDPQNPDHLQYFITNTNKIFQSGGVWDAANSIHGFYGTNYLYAPVGQGLSWVRWSFSIPVAGTYDLSATWPKSSKNASGVSYVITHGMGTAVVQKNQNKDGNRWVPLGSFPFDPGEYSVVLGDNATGPKAVVMADAIRITSSAGSNVFDLVVDNGRCPTPHYGRKAIIFRKDLEIDPAQLRYGRLFYDGCYTGPYYLGTFRRGLTFYTVTDSEGLGSGAYIRAYLAGKSDEEIWATMQLIMPVYDYFDFTKPPAAQGITKARQSPAVSVRPSVLPATADGLDKLDVRQAFAELQDEQFVYDEDLSHLAVLKAFSHRKAVGVALAMSRLASLLPQSGGHRVLESVVARRIFEAFPEESVPGLLDLYARSDAATRGSVVRAAAGMVSLEPVGKLLRAALDDRNECETEGPESMGEPLRVCDEASNQLVLRGAAKGALRLINPAWPVESRDEQIAALKAGL